MKLTLSGKTVCKLSLALALCAPLALQAQTAPPTSIKNTVTGADAANELSVSVGKSVLVDTARPIARVAVGSGEVAEATAVSPSEVMVNGKIPGETTLIVWETGGDRHFFNVTVRASNAVVNDKLDALRRELRTELPGQQLKITTENGLIFLRGTVKDLNSSDRAVQIASTSGKVVNLLYVNVPAADPQILLKVRFASVDRTLTKQLGINLFSLGGANSIGSVTTQQFSPPSITTGSSSGSSPTTPTATLSSLLNLFIYRPDINLGATIQALETEGVVQILAEPNLLAANGKEASFLAGGEYPYPTLQSSGGVGTAAVTIQFKEFGVRLNFIPTITPRGTIRLQVAPEVSSLDFANGLTISGFNIPSLDTRKVRTEVELGEGESFAIGGLLDNRETKNFSKIPFIGDIPVLGKFFQSISKTRTNTELMVIVTPEIVAPSAAPIPGPHYPDKFLPSNSNMAMTTPGAEGTGAKSQPAAPHSMPVEKLVESMQPEQPLVIDTISVGSALPASTLGTRVPVPPTP